MSAPQINPLPPLGPSRLARPETVNEEGEAFASAWRPTCEQINSALTWLNETAEAVDDSASAAAASVTAAEGFKDDAESAATAAEGFKNDTETFAQSVINTANSIGSSTTNLAFSTGTKNITTQTGKSWVSGMWLQLALVADPTKYMIGSVTSYDSGTGALVMTVVSENHTGSFSSWNIFQTGPLDLVNILEPRNVTANTTFAQADDINFDTSGGSITQPIPAPLPGQQLLLHRMGGNDLNLVPDSGVSIRGAVNTVTSADTLIPHDGETLNIVYKSATVWEAR